MVDSSDGEALVKHEPELPARDPITGRSLSGWILISALLLIASMAWALYDEAYGQRPWKGIQQEFVKRYTAYLKSRLNDAGKSEAEVKEDPEYQKLADDAKAAADANADKKKENDAKVALIQRKLDAVTEPFQNQRGRITVINYSVETASSESAKNRLRNEVEAKKQEKIPVDMPADDGSGKTTRVEYTYTALEQVYNDLKDQKAQLLGKTAELLKTPGELAKKRDDYLKNHMVGLNQKQLRGLIAKNNDFDYKIYQVNVNAANIVDRCETCHLGIREPLELTPASMSPGGPGRKPDKFAEAFVSHPDKELLQIHDPDRFGCSSCHGGNGRATTDVVKAHGQNPFWLHPLYKKENAEAGCQQCHSADRVTQFAPTLTLGRDLFQQRGCVGCHRYEGFDREADALTNTRQTIGQLEEQIAANARQIQQDNTPPESATDEEVKRLLAEAESLRLTNSQLAARIDQLNVESHNLMQDQKKVGPNLKDVRLKLRKEWIPVWLQDPQAFRPGTKMPTFWRFKADKNGDDEIKAISAYLWQESFDGKVPEQQQSQANVAHGKELFQTRGCLACHSIGEGDDKLGGTFAANLSRVGEKAGFDYIVRWIYNPRERWAPYCPKEKRDLTREDYEKHNQPYVFDTESHSKCPNDGAELQVQNMTVMPDFRLPESDARDIAGYLFSLSGQPNYQSASFMDDPNLKEKGRTLIKQYGCAGCHEIKGFEEEQRIGKELTTEGATPIERLDFALTTKDAEVGRDPHDPNRKTEEWYNHRGFFEHKLEDPSIYDRGKEKDEKDRLRMPKPYLTDEWRNALTTFLLGSVGAEGASVPQSLFYAPAEQRKQDIQNGWWVVKKYNCMGCHNVQVGQRSVLMDLPLYQTADQKEQLPPRLTSEGARVDPDWLLRFLHDPSLSGQQPPASSGASATAGPRVGNAAGQGGAAPNAPKYKPQPGADRNGVRVYLGARMPTFNFSPNELRTLVRFFMAVSAQQEPYIKENLEPLSDQERLLARTIFTSGTPCLKCHITGDPQHDKNAIAPNFLLAGERLKPAWTHRWLLDPQQISPGTAMPSGLFKKDGDRWVVDIPQLPPAVNDYHRDHVDLLVRYMFLMNPDEQRKLMAASPAATGGAAPAARPNQQVAATSSNQKISRNRERRRVDGRNPQELTKLDGRDDRPPPDRYAVSHRAVSLLR